MKLRTQKRLLTISTLVLLAAAAVAFGWALQNPYDSVPVLTNQSSASKSRLATNKFVQVGQETRQQLWGKPLRRPLYDPPPPPPPPKKKLPPLKVELMATIVEPGNSMAIVSLPDGITEYKTIGDTLGPKESPAELIKILADSIVLKREDQEVTLRLKQ